MHLTSSPLSDLKMSEELLPRRNAFKDWLEKVTNSGEIPEILKFKSTDVLIVGPGKSGTTWLQQILHQIRTRGDEDFADIYDVTKFCPMYISSFPGYEIDVEQKAKPRIFKSHSSYESIPTVDGMKFVVVVRDPIDAMWSYVKFLNRFYGLDSDMSLEDVKNIHNSPSFNILKPIDLIANWFPHRKDSNVLWIHYEDLVKDLKSCIGKLADFIGVSLNETEIERVRLLCTFEYMSNHKEKFSGGQWLDAVMALSKDTPAWQPQAVMVRPDGGQVGQGTKLMQSDIIEFVLTSWEEVISKSLCYDTYQQLYEQNSILRDVK